MAEYTSIHRYDNGGASLGVLVAENAVHEEDLDGSDKLTVISRTRPDKRERLVWQDNADVWHEHIVDSTTDDHNGHDRVSIECLNSIAELAGVEASGDKKKQLVSAHLADLLEGTRWTVGPCSDSHFGVVELETYHKRVRECIKDLQDLTHGELVTTIEVGTHGVTSRSIGIVRARGGKTVKRAFEYRSNMANVSREVGSDEVYTAVIGYGAKVSETSIQAQITALEEIADPTEEQQAQLAKLRKKLQKVQKNEYAERLRVVVESALPLDTWGIPKGDGTFGHHCYIYTDSNCNDPTFLKRQCQAIANAVCKPVVRYRFNVAEVDSDMWSDVRLGNRVLCIDDDLGDVPNDPNAGTLKRISRIRRQLAGRMSCVIEIGERTNPLLDQFVATERIARAATGNGSKVVSGAPIQTGGNYAADDYSWYDEPGEGGEETPKPFAIEIVTLPDKLDYYEGEEIDYTGIVVELRNEDESLFTDENYPDGIVPFDELELPKNCPAPTVPSGVTTDLALPEGWESPFPVYKYVKHEEQSLNYHLDEFTLDPDSVMLVEKNGGPVGESARLNFLLVSPRTDSCVEHHGKTTWAGGGSESTTREGTGSGSSVTRNGKTAYFSNRGTSYGGTVSDAKEYIPEVWPGKPGIDPTTELGGNLVWAAIYGDIAGGKAEIPVKWTSKYDGQVLTDSFEVNVTLDYSDEYDGSGGGKFDDEDEPFWPYGNPNDDIPEQY